jgi:D-serine dehydratase
MHDFSDPLIDSGFKGFPHQQPALRRSAIGAQGWNVLRGDLPLPMAVIRRDALQANLAWMQAFARDHGADMAPHGKTTMSPQLFQRQMQAGAWGITFATVGQAHVGINAGVRNCLIANQVLTDADLAAIVQLRRDMPDLRLLFLVDSIGQLDLIEQWCIRSGNTEPFEVLLEIGLDGGRTGCRDHADALQLAYRLDAGNATRLVGIECYEGLWGKGDSQADAALADKLMARVVAIAQECDKGGLFASPEIIISAGGSSIFDLVARHMRPSLSRPVRALLRSGCYVTFDHGSYKRMMSVMDSRLSCGHGLQSALEVWATVQSRPEPGLAIVAAGKRDLSFDVSMPIAVWVCRHGADTPTPAPAEWHVTGLNDQHTYLRAPVGATIDLQVGDRVGLGISHPCTTFDKWRWMAIVDDGYNVRDAIVTCF